MRVGDQISSAVEGNRRHNVNASRKGSKAITVSVVGTGPSSSASSQPSRKATAVA